jgi:hypothetical protein
MNMWRAASAILDHSRALPHVMRAAGERATAAR